MSDWIPSLYTSQSHQTAVDERMRELGLASAADAYPGLDRYYGPGVEEKYEDAAIRNLGYLPDGGFASPAEARAAWDEEEAAFDQMADAYLAEHDDDAAGM